jgi:hypothetical protein
MVIYIFTVATSYKATMEEFFEKSAGEDAKMGSKLLGINFNGLIKRKFPLSPALPPRERWNSTFYHCIHLRGQGFKDG